MNCPKCNHQELVVETEKEITASVCIGCGYRTRSDYNVKNFEFQPTLVMMSEENKKMIWKDANTGLYWFPISFDIPNVGVLYPQGTAENMQWVYMPMIELNDKEKRQMPGKKERPDEIRKRTYDSSNLKEALKLLKVIE